MKCKVDGCSRDAMYKGKRVCQMHYFRKMRTGSYEKKERDVISYHSNGYILRFAPSHPLSQKSGRVYEHRFVYYNEISKTVSKCEMCGRPVNWRNVHIDHIDEDRRNNKKENLRPLCNGCNVSRNRDFSKQARHFLTYKGETKSLMEWTRDSRVDVSNTCILHRKRRGMSDEEALFSKKITHNGNIYKRQTKSRLTSKKAEEKNYTRL